MTPGFNWFEQLDGVPEKKLDKLLDAREKWTQEFIEMHIAKWHLEWEIAVWFKKKCGVYIWLKYGYYYSSQVILLIMFPNSTTAGSTIL